MKQYNTTKKKLFVHRANRNRTSESDIPAKFRVIGYAKKHFGLRGLTDEVIKIPDGAASYRRPDILFKPQERTQGFVILLHGGIHGSGDEVSTRGKDVAALEDYAKANMLVMELYAELTENYSEDFVIRAFQLLGFQRLTS